MPTIFQKRIYFGRVYFWKIDFLLLGWAQLASIFKNLLFVIHTAYTDYVHCSSIKVHSSIQYIQLTYSKIIWSKKIDLGGPTKQKLMGGCTKLVWGGQCCQHKIRYWAPVFLVVRQTLLWFSQHKSFSDFSCMFLNSNIFFQFEF